MSNKMRRPKIRLSRLRDIGWSYWDPIGLLADGSTWLGKPFADEYDSYLVLAAGMLRRKQAKSEVAQYLTDVEVDHMGMGENQTAVFRATRTVEAIIDDEQLWT